MQKTIVERIESAEIQPEFLYLLYISLTNGQYDVLIFDYLLNSPEIDVFEKIICSYLTTY